MSTERQSTTALLSHTPRSQSLSPRRAENTHHLDPLRMDSATPGWADTSPTSTSQAVSASNHVEDWSSFFASRWQRRAVRDVASQKVFLQHCAVTCSQSIIFQNANN